MFQVVFIHAAFFFLMMLLCTKSLFFGSNDRGVRFTHIPKLQAPLTWAEQGHNSANVCSGTWVRTAELAAAKQHHQEPEGTSGSLTQAEQGGQCLWHPGPGAQAGGSPSTRSLYLPPHIWGDTQCPWDGQDPAPKLLSQKPVWQHHEVYGRNQPKVFPSMDYSQFSCYSPSCCNLSPKNTCALFVLERLFVLASADWKYPVSN